MPERRDRNPRAALVLAALLLPALLPGVGYAQKKPGEEGVAVTAKGVTVNDKLTATDPDDPLGKTNKSRSGCRAKIYPYKLEAEQLYTFNLTTSAFNALLRLEDARGKVLTDSDQGFIRPTGNSTFFYFRPKTAGTYRAVVTTAVAGQTGEFSLNVIPWGDFSGGEKGLSVTSQLAASDPVDPGRGSFTKIYNVKLTVGRRYVIDLISGDYDAYLRLEDSRGAQLAANDDNRVSLNSRIEFQPARTDTYRIIATSLGAGFVGKFTLWVTPVRLGARSDPPPPPAVPRSPLAGTVPGMHGGMGMGPMGGFPGRPLTTEVTIGDITITSEPPLMPGSRGFNDTHGYIEYRLTVRNKSAEPHRVALTVPRSRPGFQGQNYLRFLRRAVEVGPDSTATVSLFQPDLPILFGNDVEIAIDGQAQADSLFMNVQPNRGRGMSGMHHAGPPGMGVPGMAGAYLLAPQDLASTLDGNASRSAIDDPRAVAAPGMVRGGVFGNRSFNLNGKVYFFPVNHAFTPAPDPKTWGRENWLAYSCFDGVALRGGQLEDMPAAARAALWRYVECGGSLLVVGPTKLPDGWKSVPVSGLTAYYPGFGQCLVAEDTDPAKWSPEQWRAVVGMWEQAALPYQHVRSPHDANSLFPVVENRGVPVRGLFAGMLVFAILVGPVNVYVLTRQRRRIWLLWTVPVFSLLTCAAVFVFMVISEGWSGHVRVTGVTVLDEASQRASSVGWLGVYSPITPGDGLHFGYDTEVTPQLKEDFSRGYYRRDGSGRTIDWTNDQHLASGWVKALMPAHFAMRGSEQRLERLTVTRGDGGTLKAVNALKAPVARLWLADAKGQIHTAEDIAPGKEVVLKASGQKAEGKAEVLREVFTGDWLTLSKTLTARPEQFLRPGTYLAELEGAPFLEQGLRGARLRPGRSVVFGILKEVPGDAR
jgi:hypothetical protein